MGEAPSRAGRYQNEAQAAKTEKINILKDAPQLTDDGSRVFLQGSRVQNLRRNVGLLLSLGVGLSLWSKTAYGGSVIRKDKSKKIVIMSLIRQSGYRKGDEVCVFDGAMRLTCGYISKIKSKQAHVRVPNEDFNKVKVGMEMRRLGAKAQQMRRGTKTYKKSTGRSKKKKTKTTRQDVVFKPVMILTPLSPTSFYALSYLAPTPSSESLWQREEEVSAAIMGGGVEMGFRLRGDLMLFFGGRYRQFCAMDFACSFSYDADYVTTSSNLYVSTTQEATAFGVWFDVSYGLKLGSKLTLWLGGGVDSDISSMSFTAIQRDDANPSLEKLMFSATSDATVLSLRLVPNLHYFINPVGISFGLPLLIPVATVGADLAADVDDDNTAIFTDPIADLGDSLAHGHSGFAVEVQFAVYLAF